MQLRALFRISAGEERTPDLEAQYAIWRWEAKAVAKSYRSWTRAPREERWLAYATYLAVLDRQEHAARVYERLVERVQKR